eukprot:7692399-Alexandrium_andersonii.AAC.1
MIVLSRANCQGLRGLADRGVELALFRFRDLGPPRLQFPSADSESARAMAQNTPQELRGPIF